MLTWFSCKTTSWTVQYHGQITGIDFFMDTKGNLASIWIGWIIWFSYIYTSYFVVLHAFIDIK